MSAAVLMWWQCDEARVVAVWVSEVKGKEEEDEDEEDDPCSSLRLL